MAIRWCVLTVSSNKLVTHECGAMQVCQACNRTGATLCCSARGCKTAYHYPCAQGTGKFNSTHDKRLAEYTLVWYFARMCTEGGTISNHLLKAQRYHIELISVSVTINDSNVIVNIDLIMVITKHCCKSPLL